MVVKSTCWRMEIVHKDGRPPLTMDYPDANPETVLRTLAALSRDYRLTDADLGRFIRQIDRSFSAQWGHGLDGGGVVEQTAGGR